MKLLAKFMSKRPILFFIMGYIRVFFRRMTWKQANFSSVAKQYLKQLKKHGYCVIENYYTQEHCQLLILQLRKFMAEQPEYVHHKEDDRLFGIEHASSQIMAFKEDPLFLGIASTVNGVSSTAAFTLAGILHGEKKGSSGAGWHRDAFFSQFKAMLYLTDVNEENGPFQFIEGSHHLGSVLRDSCLAKSKCMHDRLDDRQVELIVGRNPSRLKTLTAKAGTVILFNSSGIHRGKPIVLGERVALTNYYYETNRINAEMYKKFSVYPHFETDSMAAKPNSMGMI
jgi:hypothetical protein